MRCPNCWRERTHCPKCGSTNLFSKAKNTLIVQVPLTIGVPSQSTRIPNNKTLELAPKDIPEALQDHNTQPILLRGYICRKCGENFHERRYRRIFETRTTRNGIAITTISAEILSEMALRAEYMIRCCDNNNNCSGQSTSFQFCNAWPGSTAFYKLGLATANCSIAVGTGVELIHACDTCICAAPITREKEMWLRKQESKFLLSKSVNLVDTKTASRSGEDKPTQGDSIQQYEKTPASPLRKAILRELFGGKK